MQKFTPLEYLKIDVASNYGLDKTTWDTRLAWFHANEHHLEELTKDAEEPALFYAGVQAYKKAAAGQPIKYMINLDATASGAQILAAIVGCEKSARMCNVIDTGEREDFYTNVFRGMESRVGDCGSFDRSKVKAAAMTWLYGSSAEPKKAFGEGAVLDAFYQTMFEDAPGASELNMGLVSLWDPSAYSYDWIMPDNFHVHDNVEGKVKHQAFFMDKTYDVIEKVNQPSDFGLSIGANTTHSIDGMVVREMERRCDYDLDQYVYLAEMIMQSSYARGKAIKVDREKDDMVLTLWQHYKDSGFLSARILDHLDHYNMGLVDYSVILKLLKSMPEKPFKVLSIHDCFRCHPNYGNDLRQQYNQILSELAASDILLFITWQVTKGNVQVSKLADISKDVLNANYALS